jgi:hypothetical protein
MRKVLTGLFMLGVLGGASTASATPGTVDMSWDNCSPLITDKSTTTAGQYGMFVSVIGHDEPHEGYNVWGILGTAARSTPDAWAFDAAGCQTPAFVTLDHQAPGAVAKTCPSFQGTLASVPVKSFDIPPPEMGYGTTIRRFVIANAYPAGIPVSNPATRYFLARVLFDHTFSVVGPTDPGNNCGGFENAICLTLLPYKLQYLDANGAEQMFNIASGNHFATFNNAGNGMGCPGVPVAPTTWGQIKSQYRQ